MAHRHDVDLEGACEGVCACSTCHLIFPASIYNQLPELLEYEEDMLDMAFGLTETSQLGCQVIVITGNGECSIGVAQGGDKLLCGWACPKAALGSQEGSGA